MAILRPKEISKLSQKERNDKLTELKKELMKSRSQIASKTMPENPGRIREIRRTIARIKTFEKEAPKSKIKQKGGNEKKHE